MTVARYTFLPWLRRGLSNRIASPAGAGASRATLVVSLSAKSDAGETPLPPRNVRLVGPGDVGGIVAEQVVRTEPRAGVADFEPNYLASIDFYDEDFAWRYSPLAADEAAHRLIPWIALVVLMGTEFRRVAIPGRTLPSFVLTAAANRADLFPPLEQEWAWAHVHLNEALPGTPGAPDLGALGARLAANPDLGCCRLVCPRRLEPNSAYSAFVVPLFEVGRKAGLDQPVAETEDGSLRAWQGAADEFPIYHEWAFMTGVEGDFESLVRALVPRDVNPRVGIRDLDVTGPDFGLASIANPPDGLVGLEGALLAPTSVRRGLSPASDFVPRLEPVLNAPADARSAGEADPRVAPPIYGCWHAKVERVSATASGWVTELNLDPRARASAGLGARVVRTHQEKYMRLAWEQIGEVVTVNHKIRRAQLAIKASAAIHARSVAPMSPDRVALLAAPVFGKVLGSPVTLRALVNASRVPRAALSPALRKQMRPRGPLARRALPDRLRRAGTADLLRAVNAGTASAAPPRGAPGGATLEGIGAETAPPPGVLRRHRWAILLILALLILLLLIFVSPLVALLAAVPAIAIAVAAFRPPPRHEAGELLSPAGLTAEAIASTPARPDFSYAGPAEASLPGSAGAPSTSPVPGDSADAAAMRRALADFQAALSVRVEPEPPRPELDLTVVSAKALAAIEPHRAIAGRFAPLLRVGGLDVRGYARERYAGGRGGREQDILREVMDYPDIKLPMYEPVDKLPGDYFVPNLHLIPNNSISLMLVNRPFIESYMAGLNHEFARELLWREYPTDQQGTPFRQFWDVSNFVDPLARDPKILAEALKDIEPIHLWPADTALGAHDRRDQNGEQLVLVIRGDLLKRYPNTFIYAQRALWGTGARANRLVLADESGELFATNPTDPRLKFPLYRAQVAPDIHFIGFDLSLGQARGDARLEETAAARATVAAGDLGWFFVLQEAVGEPRFGMDVNAPVEPGASKWDNLSWTDLDLTGGQAINLARSFASEPAGSDGGVQWNANAADMASILYQDPVMVGIHGRTMLKALTAGGPGNG